MTDFAYRYLAPSRADGDDLLLSTSGGVTLDRVRTNPYFFSGFLTSPAVTAEGLRAVAAVAASSFAARPPVGFFDPVVTSNGDRLRFESFSSCGGVQARLDLLEEGFDGQLLDRGTTNVDINEPLRRFLAQVSAEATVRLSVGSDELIVSAPGATITERKVRLPSRWVRGFAEVQTIASGFEPRLELDARAGASFLAALPRDASGWVVKAGPAWRLSSRPVPGAVFLGRTERLGAMLPLMRHATRLRAYGPTVPTATSAAPSAWELDLPGSRFVILLSPDASRGFAGEGANLVRIADEDAASDADLVHELLSFEPRLDLGRLALDSGLDHARVRAAVAHLAASGQVGYDLAEAGFFHRELPYDPASIEALNPRLRDARSLVAAGAVTLGHASTPGEAVFEVTSRSRVYRVRERADGTSSCTCRWWTGHQGQRGPCKHVLAVQMTRTGPGVPAGVATTPETAE